MPNSFRGLYPTRPSLLFLLALAGAASPSGSSAQTEVQDTFHLGEVVVTANRAATPQIRIPQAVTVLHGDDLRGRGVHLLADAVREVPGLQIVRTGSLGATTSVFLRGGNSDFVKVLMDGVPLNEPGGRFDFGTLTLENVERIEVVRGPGSVLYGSDAVSGVIQIFTRDGSGPAAAAASLQAGSMGTWNGEAGVRGAGERVEYSVSLGRSRSDGIYPLNSGFRSLVGSGRVSVSPDARSRIQASLRVHESQHRFPTNSSGEVADSNQLSFDEGVVVSLEGSRVLRPTLTGALQLRLSQGERGFENDSDSPADTLGFGFAGRRLSTVLRRGGEARLAWQGVGGSWIGGMEWEVERERRLARTESNFGSGREVSSESFEGDRWNGALFLQGSLDGPLGTVWNVGVRGDENEVFGSFFTPQAGVVVPVGGGRRLRASVGSSYKAPTFSEQFAASPFEVGNPELQPEESRSWEVGWDGGFLSNRIVLGTAWFRQDFSNLIQYAFQGADAPSYRNVDRARAQGVESSLVLRGPVGSRLTANHTWLESRAVHRPGEAPAGGDDVRLLRRPTHLVGGSARIPLPGSAHMGITATRVGDRADMDFRSWPSQRVVLDAYTLLDADLQFPLVGSGRPGATPVLVTLRAENLSDANYESVVGFPGMGRRFLLGLRWNP